MKGEQPVFKRAFTPKLLAMIFRREKSFLAMLFRNEKPFLAMLFRNEKSFLAMLFRNEKSFLAMLSHYPGGNFRSEKVFFSDDF